VDGDASWGIDSKADFVASNINDRYLDVVPDHDRFFPLPGEDQHGVLLANLPCASLRDGRGTVQMAPGL
jgi:hypothetical protein